MVLLCCAAGFCSDLTGESIFVVSFRRIISVAAGVVNDTSNAQRGERMRSARISGSVGSVTHGVVLYLNILFDVDRDV